MQDVSDGAAAASGDVRDGSVSGQEETGESLTGPVDAPAENGVQEDGDSQASGDEASGQPVEDTDQSAVDAAPADSGEPSEDQSSEPENSIVYLDDESSDGGQAAGTDASKDGAASENTEGENEVPEQGAEDGSTIQESGAEGQQAQAEDPSQGSVSLADYLTGATAVYYSRTAGNDGEDEWKPVENDTVLMPSDKIRVYLAYQLPGGLLNGTDSRARYMLPEQLWLSGSRVDRINHFENGIASGTEDETEKASLLGAEAVEGTRRPDEQRSGQTEFISAIVNIENVQDAEGRLSGQELVFRFVPYTVEKNSDVFDAEGALSSKGQEVNGYFTIDYMVNEILSGIAADGGASSDQAAEQVREAVIVFASVNTESGQREISAKLKISETAAEADPEEQDSKTAEEDPESAEGENAQADPESEEGENAQTDPESEEGEEAQTDSESEEGEGVQTDPESAEGETAQKDPESADEETEDKDADEENEGGEITADASDGSDSAAEAAGGLSDQLPDMPAQNFEQTIRVKTGGTGSGNAVSDFFKNLFGFFTGNGGADSDDAGEALSSEADLTVHVDADEGTFPAGTTMTVKAVSGRELNAVSEAISDTVDSETCGFQAVDITFRDAQGEEIEPKKPVRVTFSTDLINEAAQNDKIGQPVIVHVQDDGSAQALSSNAAAEGPARAAEERIAAGTGATVGLEQGSVTFEAGETAESEQTGNNIGEGGTADPDQNGNGSQDGSAVESGQNDDHNGSDVSDDSRQSGDVVEESEPEDKAETQTNEEEEADGITVDADSFSIYAIVYTVDFYWEVNGKTYEFSLPGGGYVPFKTLMEILGVADGNPKVQAADADDAEADEDQTQAALMLTGIEASEKTKELVRYVTNVTFSSPELMWVGKAGEDTTVGALKEANSLEVQYSADLTEEQISQINAQAVKAGEWILISLQPFESEETLTVTMSTGEAFTVRVTDAAYTVTQVTTDFNGKTGALVNLNSVNNKPINNALQDTQTEEHKSQGRLDAVSISLNSGVLTSSVPLTEWTFEKVKGPGTDNQYYISPSEDQYLNINIEGNSGSISVSSTKQPLFVEQKNDGRIRIKRSSNDDYTVNNENNKTENGYQAYYSTWDDNPGEWFTFYDLEEYRQSLPVRLHFVKDDGNGTPISVTYADGTAVEGSDTDDGAVIYLDKLTIKDNGIIDLDQFLVDGYTLSNTHKSTWQDLSKTSGWNYQTDPPHTIIGNSLKWNNGVLKYQAFYTNSDKAGSDWFQAGTKPNQWHKESNDHGVANDNVFDYYLVYSPVKGTTSTGGGQSTATPELGTIGKSKVLTSNYDGTYNLELGVSTQADWFNEEKNLNVILVVDTSSSMQRYYYNENDAPKLKDDPDSRYYLTTHAVNDFITELDKNNTNTRPKAVEYSLIYFNENANLSVDWTENGDIIKNAVSSLPVAKGTNWAHGLRLAKEQYEKKKNEADLTVVVFMTDGAPSQYWANVLRGGNDSNTQLFVAGEGCYLGARDEARALVNEGAVLYGLFSYGPDQDFQNNYIGSLVNYAYNNGEAEKTYKMEAQKDKTALAKNLEKVLKFISNEVGFSDVQIHDGITELTTVTFEDVEPESFTYTITYKDYDQANSSFTEKTAAVMVRKETINGKEEDIIDIPAITYHILKNGNVQEIVTQAVSIKGAVFNKNSSEKYVEWKFIKDDGTPYLTEQGWTYKVKFKIWPSQPTYDLLAALNNGILSWGDDYTYTDESGSHTISANDYMAQIINNHPLYILRTNTDAYVTYKETTAKTEGNETTYVTGEELTVPLPEVGGMPLDNTQITLEKVWNTTLAHDDYDKISSVDFYIMQDNVNAVGFNKDNSSTYYKKVTLYKDNDWKATVSIAPGIYDQDGKLKTTGHDYSVLEPEIDGHYELEAVPIHPMLDGRTHDNDAQIRDMVDIYDPNNLSVFKTGEDGNCVYSVANTLKAGINIKKELDVTDEQRGYLNTNEYFTIKVELKDQEGHPVYSTTDGGGAVGYRISAPPEVPTGAEVLPTGATGNDVTSYTINGVTYTYYENKDENGVVTSTGFNARGLINEDGTISLKIRECDTIRIVNVPMGTRYTVEEIVDSSSNFVFKEVRWEVKKENIIFEGKTNTFNDPKITETIVPDAENNVVFKNMPQVTLRDLTLKKVGTDLSGSGLPGAVFQLKVENGAGADQPVTAVTGYNVIKIDGQSLNTATIGGIERESVFMTTGGVQTIQNLPPGRYKLVELQAPDGYIITLNEVEFTVTREGVSKWTESNSITYTATPAEGNAQLTISNTPGAVLPHTGGPGTRIFMVLGGMLIGLAGLLFVKRQRLI